MALNPPCAQPPDEFACPFDSSKLIRETELILAQVVGYNQSRSNGFIAALQDVNVPEELVAAVVEKVRPLAGEIVKQ